jgi:hypothetical protein
MQLMTSAYVAFGLDWNGDYPERDCGDSHPTDSIEGPTGGLEVNPNNQ